MSTDSTSPQPEPTETVREARHVHTHHGLQKRLLHTNSTKDASAQVLSTVLNGANEHFDGDNTISVGKAGDLATPRSVPVDRPSRHIISTSRSSSADSQRKLERNEKNKEMKRKAEAAILTYTAGTKSAANDLAQIARNHGLDPTVRKQAWPILLATHPFSRKEVTKNLTTCPSPTSEEPPVDVPIKRIRGELSRYHRRTRRGARIDWGSSSMSGSPRPESRASTWSSTTTPASLEDDMLDLLALDSAIETALVSYLEEHPQVPYSPGMVHVALTLADWIFEAPKPFERNELDPFESICPQLTTAFAQLMTILTWYPETTVAKLRHKPQTAEDELDEVISRRMSHFLSIFRKLMPELDAYFDEEGEIWSEEWVRSWIQWWCAKELQRDNKARLWDMYLGYRPSGSRAVSTAASSTHGQETPDDSSVASIDLTDGDGEDEAPPRTSEIVTDSYSPFDWHPYVCLGILKSTKDALEELELSEIRTLLAHLPEMGSMDAIIREGGKMRAELRVLGQKEDEEAAKRGVTVGSQSVTNSAVA